MFYVLDNSIKYNLDKDGSIDVILSISYKDDSFLQVIVVDSGRGMT